MAEHRKRSKPAYGDKKGLLGCADAIEEIVRINATDIISGIEDQIERADEAGACVIVYPLPEEFTHDGGADSSEMRTMVWGVVLRHFINCSEKLELTIIPSDERGSSLQVQWKRAIPQAQLQAARELIEKHTAK